MNRTVVITIEDTDNGLRVSKTETPIPSTSTDNPRTNAVAIGETIYGWIMWYVNRQKRGENGIIRTDT